MMFGRFSWGLVSAAAIFSAAVSSSILPDEDGEEAVVVEGGGATSGAVVVCDEEEDSMIDFLDFAFDRSLDIWDSCYDPTPLEDCIKAEVPDVLEQGDIDCSTTFGGRLYAEGSCQEMFDSIAGVYSLIAENLFPDKVDPEIIDQVFATTLAEMGKDMGNCSSRVLQNAVDGYLTLVLDAVQTCHNYSQTLNQDCLDARASVLLLTEDISICTITLGARLYAEESCQDEFGRRADELLVSMEDEAEDEDEDEAYFQQLLEVYKLVLPEMARLFEEGHYYLLYQ